MTDIFFIGHGLEAIELPLVTIDRSSVVCFYCKEGEMLNGTDVSNIIDGTLPVKYFETFYDKIREHILCTTPSTWNAILHDRSFRYIETLYGDSIYIFRYTNYSGNNSRILIDTYCNRRIRGGEGWLRPQEEVGFRLSFLIRAIEQAGLDRAGEYIFHWTACRSIVHGRNEVEIINDYIRQGGNLFRLSRIVPPNNEIEYPRHAELVR